MVPFLVETLDGGIQFMFSKFILKSVLEKHSTPSMLLKINPNDVKNHFSIADVDLSFAVKYELQVL